MSQICGLSKCTSAWHSFCGCQVCEPVGSQGNVTCHSQSLGDFYFNEKQTSFGESWGIVPCKLTVRKWSLTKLVGFPQNQVSPTLTAVLCKSPDLESSQIPKEGRISYHLRCSTMMPASLLVFLLIVPSAVYFTTRPFHPILVKVFAVIPSPFLVCPSSLWPSCTDFIEKSV